MEDNFAKMKGTNFDHKKKSKMNVKLVNDEGANLEPEDGDLGIDLFQCCKSNDYSFILICFLLSIILYTAMVERIREGTLDIENFCLICFTEISSGKALEHPLFDGGICKGKCQVHL